MPPRKPMTPDDPRHGTVNGYGNQKCRCDPCKAAKAAEAREYNAKSAERRKQRYAANRERYLADRKAYVAANREVVRERQKRWYQQNAERILASQRAAYSPKVYERNRAVQLRLKYSLSPDDYDSMHEAQGGVCAICGRPPSGRTAKTNKLYIDHCHDSGRVRGLLCGRCNTALGCFRDDVEVMMKAIEYLKVAHDADHGDGTASTEDR